MSNNVVVVEIKKAVVTVIGNLQELTDDELFKLYKGITFEHALRKRIKERIEKAKRNASSN